MLERISENLTRQLKGLEVMDLLLEEEFSHLTSRKTDAVIGIELSIQELLRQFSKEKAELRKIAKMMDKKATRISDLIGVFHGKADGELTELLDKVERKERVCAFKARRNAVMAQALMDQGRKLIDEFCEAVIPKDNTTYGHGGRVAAPRLNASLIQGRM
jgi:flagellar biosynthesis/type III secretory pathway chaperone